MTTTSEIVGRSLTYVEMDLDVFRATQFEAVRAGEDVANWSRVWDQHSNMRGVIDPSMPSGRAARLTKHTVSDTSFWRWNLAPNIQDVSALAYMVNDFNSANSTLRVFVRGAGNDDNETGYMLRMAVNTGLISISRFLNGVATGLATVALAFDLTTPWWIRFDAVNIAGGSVLLRAKLWQGAASDEPSVFIISATDASSPITAAGASGVGITDTSADAINVGYFRVRSILGSLVETHRHAISTDFLPREPFAVPDLVSISIQPTELSLGENLGTRTKVTAQLRDHRDADLGEFFNNGMKWSKFRARELFRRGQPFRRIQKLLDTDTEETRHYILEAFNGPSISGVFTLVAQDAIKLADNDRAQCPVLTNGFLSATLAAAGTSFNILPAGQGDIDYSTSGFVVIGGKEVIQFTRVANAFTVTGGVAGRGLFGTTAIAHAAEDRVQLCEFFNADDPATIIERLFTVFAGIDSALIPIADWLLEVDTYLDRLYTRLIVEPTGVNKLASELIEQAGLMVWPDEVSNTIKLQVLRGIPTTAFEYNQANTLGGSMGVQEQLDKRITQVWTYYGVRNVCEPLDQPNNYRSTLEVIDTEGQTEHGEAIIRKVFASWIPAFARSTAQRVNDLILGRFKTPPRKFSFAVMRYSGIVEPSLGSGARISWWGSEDELGIQHNVPIQITYVDPQADKFDVRAEEMLFTTLDTEQNRDRVITIDGNINNINLRSLHDNQYPEIVADDLGYDGITVTFIIAADVIVGSATTALRAIDVGSWIVGVPLFLRIIGRGQGCGGRGGNGNAGGGEPGQIGGVALYTRYPITLVNEGELWGGAGGGGTGMTPTGAAGSFCGGGGAGQVPGAGGVRSGSHVGQPGTTEVGGQGFDPGGDGGGPGLVGQTGTGTINTQQPGGQPGAAIDGVSFVTIQTAGDIRGGQIN